MKANVLKVHPQDDVIVALTDLKKGEAITLDNDTYLLQDNITAKHKFAARNFAVGEPVRMYGVLVGRAMLPIPRGGLISTQNLTHAASEYSGRTRQYTWTPPDVCKR